MTPFSLPIEVALAAPIETLPDHLDGEFVQAKWDGSPDTRTCLTRVA
ncbi:hypothetical protein [Streptomyces sp. TLI_171]|nr:hypothetical protein [Streptomyces sp. TLI_171]